MIIITNNKKVYLKYKGQYKIDYSSCSFEDILIKVRDKVHSGHKIYTHPLSSSVKPNETPYKSVIISKEHKQLHYESLKIIENSIDVYRKFKKNVLQFKEVNDEDFQLIDLSVLESALNKI